ncbi:MAG: glucoamylase family protein [Candidatus Omnitrophica bacterium]|nr:glucoamylase family protein [Candidatus Omnitrophota bacterium]
MDKIVSAVLACAVFASTAFIPASWATGEARPALSKADEEFLDKVEHDTFLYFWEKADPETGLIADNSQPGAPSSIAATGFGLAAICIGQSRGWITYDEAYKRAFRTLRTFKNTLKSERGFYYHFVDMKTGRRVWNSEVSSIDTALFLAGALLAAQYFKGTELERLATYLYYRTDWQWMMNQKQLMSMGWDPKKGFLSAYWDWYNEGLIAYILAIGSPTYPIPPETWKKWRRPRGEYGGHRIIYSYFGSLFTYQFAQAWVDFRNIDEEGFSYWQNSIDAALANRKFCIDNSKKYKGYGENGWGLTAGDGPGGYKGYGALPADNITHDGTINPYGMVASIPLIPDTAIKSVRALYNKYGDKVYGRYGFKAGFNLDKNWWSGNYIGIDQGVSVLMIEDYRTGLVWDYFMRNGCIKSWMELCKLGNKNLEALPRL